jgi:copper chaperone NosL
MTIADPRFAGELVLRTGKIYRFDDPGCLAAFVRERIPAAKVQSAWVNDFAHPDRLLDAGQASYLLSDTLRTPMASHLAALNPGREADSVQSALGGRLLTWDQVLGEVGGPPDR